MTSFDLNLLKTLIVLLELKSVTLTADHLNTSQPTVSRSLAKLREFFNDRLLIKVGKGFELTDKALDLKTNISPLILELDCLLNEEKDFFPLEIHETITISLNSVIAHWLVPVLQPLFLKQAPKMEVIYTDWTSGSRNEIENGLVQLGLNYFPLDIPKNLSQQVCGTESFVCICRKGHPQNNSSFTQNDLALYPLAIHNIINFNHKKPIVNSYYDRFKIEPNIKLKSTHLNLILNSLTKSDMFFPSSKFLAKTLSNEFRFVELDKALQFESCKIAIVCRLQWRNSPMYKWLSSLIVGAIKSIENQ